MPPPSNYDTYSSPLASRNASERMLQLWSPRHKFNTWRRIWLAVAEAQHELGLPVTREQVEELRAVVTRPGGITDDELKAAEKYERDLRHDVMAHVHALGDSCPKAKGIIHLGMTSQDVVCNADLLIIREAEDIIVRKITRTAVSIGNAAELNKSVPTLGFTHYQPAQPTTVGRRFTGWVYDLILTCNRFEERHTRPIRLRGLRGATGTQASFLALLKNDSDAVDLLEHLVLSSFLPADHVFSLRSEDIEADRNDKLARLSAVNARAPSESRTEHIEFLKRATTQELRRQQITWHNEADSYQLTTQTYPRVIDTFILADLASTASVLHKIATDIRLLCNRKEVDEPFEDKQIGSSAMPYKRNPMRCERICGLARFVMNLVGNAYDTAATQWLERTLDDSSNRRLSLPEAFLALDGALDLMHNVASGLVVYEATIRKNLMAELPFMATENILMACVKLGADRQEYHEHIRAHAQAAGTRVKQDGKDNDLLDRLQADKHFWSTTRGGPLTAELDWQGVMDPMKYIGRSVEQAERFISEVIDPLRTQYAESIAKLGSNTPKV